MFQALTDTGAFHIERLHLNRQQLVEARRGRRRRSGQREAIERERLKRLLDRLREVIAKIKDIYSSE